MTIKRSTNVRGRAWLFCVAGLLLAAFSVEALQEGRGIQREDEKRSGRNIEEELGRLKEKIEEKRAALPAQDKMRLDQQIARLGGFSEKGRLQAVKLLSANLDRIILLIAPHLYSKNRRIRESVCRLIVGYAGDGALAMLEPLFFDMLRSRQRDSRKCALEAYGKISPSRAVDRMVEQLTALDEELQYLALGVLDRIALRELAKYEMVLDQYVETVSQDIRWYWLERRGRHLLAKLSQAKSDDNRRP